jgi:AraC-like DNA-binding protein
VLQRNAVSLVISGQKTMHFAGRTVNTNDKEIHFLSAGNCIASVDIARQDQFQSILIFFENKVLADFYVSNDAFIEKARSENKLAFSPYIAFKKNSYVNNYIRSLQLLINNKKGLTPPIKQLKLQELLLYLLENHTETFLSFRNPAAASPVELLVRKVVESKQTADLTIDELAFLCNLSTSTFKRHFKKIYGAAPKTWFLEQKMKAAAKLLAKHHEKPGEIWFKVGFETHSGFTKSLKKYFGVSPKHFSAKLTDREQFLNRQE